MSDTAPEVHEGAWFATQKECTSTIKALALKQGKSVHLVKEGGGGGYLRYRCSGGDTCRFSINIQKSRSATKHGYCIIYCQLDHDICTGTLSIAATQLRQLQSARLLVAADPRISGKALVEHVRSTVGATISVKEALRGRSQIVDDLVGSLESSFGRLRSLLNCWQRLNPTSVSACEFGADGQFVRAFISHPTAPTYADAGQAVLGFDGTHLKVRQFKSIALLLLGRDGDNRNIVLAVAICSSESEENCSWFIRLCHAAKLPVLTAPIFADRGSGFLSCIATLGLDGVRYCTRHIENNVRSRFKSACPADIKRVIYRIQAAESTPRYESELAVLALTHPQIADYLRGIDPQRWVLFTALGRQRLHGWRSTNFVEGENSAALPSRRMHPYDFFQHYMERFMQSTWEARQKAAAWETAGLVLTRFAHEQIKEQQLEASFCKVLPSEDDLVFVFDSRSHPVIKRRVHLLDRTCSCTYIDQHGLPYKHFIAALAFLQRMDELFEMADRCYKIEAFKSLNGHDLPSAIELVLSDAITVNDNDLPPHREKNKRGRTQERRFQSRGDAVRAVGKARRVANCGLCGASGHNRRSCTQA